MVGDRVAGHIVEKRVIKGLGGLANDIACQLRANQGKAVIVCERPSVLLSPVKKQWVKLTYQSQQEWACTLDAQKLQAVATEIAWMQARSFSAKADPEALELLRADVVFATVEELLRFASDCQALYITYPIIRKQLYIITAWMPRSGTIIIYNNSLQYNG